MKKDQSKEEKEEEGEEEDECAKIGVVCADMPDMSKLQEVAKSIRVVLKERGNVIMTRLNDDDLEKIDALVEVELFKSRSEAVAYFIHEGIKARRDLFDKVTPTVEKIRQLKKEARETLEKPSDES